MQASKRMAEEAPSSSILELLLLNLLAFPLLHCICLCWCWYGCCCGCCCFPFFAFRDRFGGGLGQGWPWPTPKSSKKKKKKKKIKEKELKKKNHLKAFGYAYKIKMSICSLPIQFSRSISGFIFYFRHHFCNYLFSKALSERTCICVRDKAELVHGKLPYMHLLFL